MMEYDHLDPTGSLMDRIQALIQPPQSEDSARKSRKTDKEARKPGRAVNHDNCDSCGEGGDLLCCDRCPCAFHLSCCDPPLEEDDIPDGEWLCNECRSRPKDVDEELVKSDGIEERETEIKEAVTNCKPESPFSTLVKMSAGKNPTTFSLPPELKCNTLFPGDRKRGSSSDEKLPAAKNGKRCGDVDEHGLPARRLCFACSRTELSGRLVHCDFCPLVFHNDCLNPPLTTPPSGMWMCPNHAEHAEPGLRDPRFSKRCQAYHDLRNNISQHTIKLNFLKKVHRLQKHPGFKRKAHFPTRRRASLVPQAIKDHYECPPVTQLPEHIRKMQDPLPLHSLPQNPPSVEDQEEWLRCVVNLQCSIAKQFSHLPSNKMLISNYNPHLLEGSTASKSDQVCTTTTSAPSSASSTLTASFTGSPRDIVANGIVTSKSELTNHVPPSSSNGVGSACINRVVTTTITTTSGGKTVTKPLTILYASPSKLQSHMNGPNASNYGKGGVSTSTVNAVSVLSNSLPTKMSIKQESKLEKTGLSTGQQKANGIAKLLNDSVHLNNMKAKTTSEGVKTASTTSTNSTKIVTATTATSSAVPTSTVSANKVTPTTPTKLLVLTNASSGNIIKTIAGTNQLSGGALLTLSGAVNSGAAKVLSGVTNSPTLTTPASCSPGRVIQGASTSAVTASAINSICAAAGVDAFNELAKLDPRLIQVLAYQRLQQLLTQSKPVPPSPVAARKITFNGLKEALVLPQQSVSAGCSIAVLCPLTGTGPVSPMVHKCLAIGKGPDMDVSLHDYGHCNFVSEKHCCIFYDEMSKQYELINYSEHGTYVDNVLYSCDFSDKLYRHITSAKGLDPSKVSKSKLLTAAENKTSVKSKVARRTVGLSVQNISQPCSCTTSSSNLIGGSGAGWEGTALLHHGSYIKVGCVQFVFSITNQATKLPASPKASSVNNTSSSSASKSSNIPS